MKNISLILIALFLSSFLHAQDMIIKKDGNKIKSRIIEVRDSVINYKLFYTKDNKILKIPVSEVSRIKYENGKLEYMGFKKVDSVNLTENVNPSNITLDSMYIIGFKEGKTLYKGNYILWASYGISLPSLIIGSLLGVVPAIVIGTIPPKPKNFIVSDSLYLNNPAYIEGYQTAAKKKKFNKAMTGMGMAFGTCILATVALIIAILSAF